MAGGFTYSASGHNVMVARYEGDGGADTSFGGGDGIVTTSLCEGNDIAYAMALDSADRIVLAGFATIDGQPDLAVARLRADGTPTTNLRQYVASPRYIDALICRDTADGATLVDGSRIYYTSDANHNVTSVLNAAGEVVERYTYTPYGEVTIHDGTWSTTYATSIIDNANLYTGRVYDGAIDLYNFRARWYNAGVGQFIGRDPIGFGGGDENLYRYCGNEPTMYVDSLGLWAITRQNDKNYASAITEWGNTIQELAWFIGLDPVEWEEWLSGPDCVVDIHGKKIPFEDIDPALDAFAPYFPHIGYDFL